MNDLWRRVNQPFTLRFPIDFNRLENNGEESPSIQRGQNVNNIKPKAPSAWVCAPLRRPPETELERDVKRFQELVRQAHASTESMNDFMLAYKQIHSLWIKWMAAMQFGLTRVEEMNELRKMARRFKAEAHSNFWTEVEELEETLFTRCVHDHRFCGQRDDHLITLLIDRLTAKRAQYRMLFSRKLCEESVISTYVDEYRAILSKEQAIKAKKEAADKGNAPFLDTVISTICAA